jgi:hypothetical protein
MRHGTHDPLASARKFGGRARPHRWVGPRGAKRGASADVGGRGAWCEISARLRRGQLRRAAAPWEVVDAAIGNPIPLVFWREEAYRGDRVCLVGRLPPQAPTAVGPQLSLTTAASLFLGRPV